MKSNFLTCIIIIFTLIVTSAFGIVYAVNFKDIDTSHWAYANINKLAKEGVINGYPDGTYRPENTVSRAEFIKLVMVALMGQEAFINNGFEGASWALPYILEANGNGYIPDDTIIINGNADLPMTRLEMAGVLAKICENNKIKAKSTTGIKTSFSDITILDKERMNYVVTIAKLGLINGYPDGTFGPLKTMTRAECSTIISRFLNLI